MVSGPLTLEYGTDRLSGNVANYQSTLRDILEERSPLLRRGGRRQLRKKYNTLWGSNARLS